MTTKGSAQERIFAGQLGWTSGHIKLKRLLSHPSALQRDGHTPPSVHARQVLIGVTKGERSKEIAKRLNIIERTALARLASI